MARQALLRVKDSRSNQWIVSPRYDLLLLVQASMVVAASVHSPRQSISCNLLSLYKVSSLFVKKLRPCKTRFGARLWTTCWKPGFSTVYIGNTSTPRWHTDSVSGLKQDCFTVCFWDEMSADQVSVTAMFYRLSFTWLYQTCRTYYLQTDNFDWLQGCYNRVNQSLYN